MKVNFNWKKANSEVVKQSRKRARRAADLMARNVRSNTPVGTESWPIYKSGPYAGQSWTSRDAGRLRGSIRVTEKKEDKGIGAFQLTTMPLFGDVRVYAGHYLAWYGKIVEFYTPFFRPAIETSKAQVRTILENG